MDEQLVLNDIGTIEDQEDSTNHIIIRLITGDEVVGRLEVAGPHTVVLSDPVLVYMASDENSTWTSFGKFSNFSRDQMFPFNRNLIISEYLPSPALVKRYDKAWEITKAAKAGIELSDEQKQSTYTKVLESSDVEQGVKH
jgi:hypothetical protein